MFFAQTDINLDKTKNVLEQLSSALFNVNSLIVLVVSVGLATIAGWVVSFVMRRISRFVAGRADASKNLSTVNRLRRIETWIILSIAAIRTLFIIFAVYFWWAATHDGSNTNALIGASALAIVVLGGIFGPMLRDFAFGAGMMAERWFGVGDLVTVDFPAVQGVVERITLRSTRLRGLNGEVIWVANQTMNGVKVAQKGVRRTAIELFANDADAAEGLVKKVNTLLPGGLSLLVSPLEVVEISQRDKATWHVTAIGETAPGREWILEKAAIDIFKQLDEKAKYPTLIVDPVARYADPDMERQLARAVRNARKKRRTINYRKAVSTIPLNRLSSTPKIVDIIPKSRKTK